MAHADLIPVQSSALRAVGYDRATHVLTILFVSGTRYAYLAVPEAIFDDLMAAESKGTYFARNIRDQFTYSRIG